MTSARCVVWQQVLLRKVAGWLKPGGRVFIHIFCHKAVPYHFEARAVPCWAGRFCSSVCPETAENQAQFLP